MEKAIFTQIEAILKADRSVRRFDESRAVDPHQLRALVGLTRYCASGRNLQPLRYRIVSDREECAALFPALAWAGYYTDWAGPAEGERPVAYIVQCLDTSLTTNPMCDEGLNLQAITLGATALGLGGCIIKAFKREMVEKALGLPAHLEPRYVLALGYPAEKVRIVDLGSDGDYKYYRDGDDTQCVPKRSLDELLVRP